MGGPDDVDLDSFPEPGNRYVFAEEFGQGAFGRVFAARDGEASGKRVAIKVQKQEEAIVEFIKQEYVVLRDLCQHSNLVEFYGIYRCKQKKEIWFVIEPADLGTVVDLSRGLLRKYRRMAEEHISYVVKETVKGLLHLHGSGLVHGDIRGSNILITKEGEVKISDFGFARPKEEASEIFGSPAFLAPEIGCGQTNCDDRVDVWSLGITAIEIGDGKAPYQEMHATRAVFQVVRNPPPTLYRPSNWSDVYNDFVEECLVKNFENRPCMEELLQHPFLLAVPENCYHLSQEVKSLALEYNELGKAERKTESVLLNANTLKALDKSAQHLLVEDLAALDTLTDSSVLEELKRRFKNKEFQTFIGDILVTINPYENCPIYGEDYHIKYKFKSRSENAPHVYSVADAAYQHALHYKEVQQIVLFGETGSGKTSNYHHIIDHLLYLGRNSNINADRITSAIKLIHSFTHASTPSNSNSTRCVFRSEITYGRTGNVSGAIFGVHLLEKLRVSCVDMPQANFHILYYFYDHMAANEETREKYHLLSDRSHRYLRIPENDSSTTPRNDPETNINKFQEMESVLNEFEFTEEDIETIYNILAAILVLGEIKFKGGATDNAEIEDSGELVENLALLLEVDEKKLCWALANYCLINKGVAMRKKQTCDEARSARDVLANNLYSRLIDYIVGFINHKLSYGRVIFGDTYSVRVTDLFGFECSKQNLLTELLVNCFNEQLHYFYLQKTFTWETLDLSDDEINFIPFTFYDNKATLERILRKPEDLVSLIDDASKRQRDGRYVIENLQNIEGNQISAVSPVEFSITHYTGTVVYNAKEIPDKNRDFLPPEIIEVLRSSKNAIVRTTFTSKLNKMGNVVTSFGEESKARILISSSSSEDENKELTHQYSQKKRMRTIAVTFRAVSLDLLKELSIGGSGGGTHFVRCIRSNLENSPWTFNNEIVRQQMKALVVTETAKERQNGYPCRITFSEFLKRYQYLAFEFDEQVDITKDNCRLLLVRLKLEDWAIGKSKVFLKYFHEEYLSIAYENKVKKVVKIQSIIRSYLVKRRLAKSEINNAPTTPQSPEAESQEDQAARVIQKAFKELSVKKALRAETYTDLDKETKEFIKYYCKKWRAKTIFQVLLQYRAARYQDLFNFSQQVHLYNQHAINCLQLIDVEVNLATIDVKANCTSWIGDIKPAVLKIPFRLDEIPYCNTSYLTNHSPRTGKATVEDEPWDSPFQWHTSDLIDIPKNINAPATLPELPYIRNPLEELPRLPSTPEPEIKQREEKPPTPRPQQKASEVEEAMNVRNRLITDSNSVVDNDFEYIKPPPVLKRRKTPEEVNPVAELHRLGRRESGKLDEDEPPFNFQKMLRKTNFKRDSLRRASDGVKTGEQHNCKKTFGVEVYNGKVEMANGNKAEGNNSEEKAFSGEILPGVFLEGFVVSL